MIQKNKKISSLQILIIGSMIGNALFVGMGNIITVLTVKNNTWFVGLCSLVLGIIPILLLNLYISYKPELNVIEKNKALFGKFFGTIINIILVIAVFIMFLINIWSFFNFAGTKYLTETPVLFIGFLFIIPLIYACTKGIETIARTIFILFFLSLIIHIIITSALFKFVNIENLKPILQIKPERIILAIKNFITYAFTPFITLTMIPKNDIVDRKKLSKYIIIGYILASAFIILVFTMNMSVVGYNIVSMFRYPEYYLIKKVTIGRAFDNMENFLSVHWIFNIFSCAVMNLYFVKEFIIKTFKIKKTKIEYLIIIILGLISIYIPTIIIENSTQELELMRYKFPNMIGLPIIGFLLISIIIILIKKILRKT